MEKLNINLNNMILSNIILDGGIAVTNVIIGKNAAFAFDYCFSEYIRIYKEIEIGDNNILYCNQFMERKVIIDSDGDLILTCDDIPTIKYHVNAVKIADISDDCELLFANYDNMWFHVKFIAKDEFGYIVDNKCDFIELEQAVNVVCKKYHTCDLYVYLYENNVAKIVADYNDILYLENVYNIMQSIDTIILVLEYKIILLAPDNRENDEKDIYEFEFNSRIMNVYSSTESEFIIVRTENKVYYFEPHHVYCDLLECSENIDNVILNITEKVLHANYFLLNDDFVCAVFDDYVYVFGNNRYCMVYPDQMIYKEADGIFYEDFHKDYYRNNKLKTISSICEKVDYENGNIIKLPSGICAVDIQYDNCVALCQDGNVYIWGIVNIYMKLFDDDIIEDDVAKAAFKSCYSVVPGYDVCKINFSRPVISIGTNNKKVSIKSGNF